MTEPRPAPAGPIGLDQSYDWPHAARLLPDAERLMALFGASPETSLPPPPVVVPAMPSEPSPGEPSPGDTAGGTTMPHRPVPLARLALDHARLVRQVAAEVVLAGVAWMLAWATLPGLVGWRPTLIVGGSMAPNINRGDVIVVRPAGAASVRVGAVVTFADPGRAGHLVTHRVVALLADGSYQTRGDHNHDPDPQAVPLTAIKGRAVLRLPYLGRPVMWAKDGRWAPLAALGVVTVALVLPLSPPRRRRRAASGAQPA